MLLITISCGLFDVFYIIEKILKYQREKIMKNTNVSFVRLGDSKPLSKEKEILIRREFNQVFSQARKNTKQDVCYYCGEKCTSFCNSHSIPQFALNKIADAGMVFSFLEKSVNPLGDKIGVKKTGTFQLICQRCDNTIFSNYEDPKGYFNTPSKIMLSQIATKNYLHLLWKTILANEIYKLDVKQYYCVAEEKLFWGKKDLNAYSKEYLFAKHSLVKEDNSYYVCFFEELNYIIPYASQAAITLVGDLEDNLINDVYNSDPNYETSHIHIMVLPLEDTSVALAFIKDGDKKYKRFYKQLRKLPLNEQLATINYILFSNTENIFMNPTVAEKFMNDESLLDVCRKTCDYVATPFYVDPIGKAIKEFSLSQRNSIPNFLSQEFAL